MYNKLASAYKKFPWGNLSNITEYLSTHFSLDDEFHDLQKTAKRKSQTEFNDVYRYILYISASLENIISQTLELKSHLAK